VGTLEPKPRYARRRQVAVPAPLLWALAAAALFGVVATAYLLGRLAAGRSEQRAAPTPLSQPATSLAGADAAPAAWGAATQAVAATPWPGAPDATAAPRAVAATPEPAPVRPESSAVAAYFSTIDGLTKGLDLSGDPQVVAQQILMSAMGGDTSQLDSLVETQRSAVRRLADLSPPAACVEHRRRTLALAQKTLSLTENLREALVNGNAEGLMGLEAIAREAENEAHDLQRLDKELRQTYGLPPKSVGA
jgi:hypothetical protein